MFQRGEGKSPPPLPWCIKLFSFQKGSGDDDWGEEEGTFSFEVDASSSTAARKRKEDRGGRGPVKMSWCQRERKRGLHCEGLPTREVSKNERIRRGEKGEEGEETAVGVVRRRGKNKVD